MNSSSAKKRRSTVVFVAALASCGSDESSSDTGAAEAVTTPTSIEPAPSPTDTTEPSDTTSTPESNTSVPISDASPDVPLRRLNLNELPDGIPLDVTGEGLVSAALAEFSLVPEPPRMEAIQDHPQVVPSDGTDFDAVIAVQAGGWCYYAPQIVAQTTESEITIALALPQVPPDEACDDEELPLLIGLQIEVQALDLALVVDGT